MDASLTILILASGFTTFAIGSNSLHLTSSPATASPGQPYTMMCSSSGSGSRARAWYWGNDLIFRTRYISVTQCPVDVANTDIYYNHLSGRVNVNCSYHQYNVTLRINTTTDNGSVWWCVDEQGSPGGQESNRLTIHVQPLVTMSSKATSSVTTTTAAKSVTSTSESTEIMSPHDGDVVGLVSSTGTATTVTTTTAGDTTTTTTTATSPNADDPSSTDFQVGDASNVVFVAVGAAVGGAVVGCVLTVLVVFMWIRRRKLNAEASTSASNIYTSPSHYASMEHQYDQAERQYVNGVEGVKTDSPDVVNVDDHTQDISYYNTVGQHQHRDEDIGDAAYYSTARDADN